MALNDIYKLALVTRFSEQVGLNILHYRVTGESGTPDLDTVAINIENEVAPLYKAVMSASAQWQGVALQRVAPITYDPHVAQVFKGPGGVAGEALPRQTAGLISWKTGVAGRANRGRMYISFPGEADNVDGIQPAPSYRTRATALGGYLLAGFSYVNTTPAWTWEAKLIIYGQSAGLGTLVTSAILRSGWATQRRRSTFGRPNAVPIP